ncbi:MAG TPA: PfkB family carbohydrate kinase [Candidatus Limnocylindrales bacterium]|nr:PfkB family carbohydrate kinase [Candidatus Limnocylindrales bacterium]
MNPVPTIVVVAAAAKDIAPDDPRGWRLGGGVSYSALTTALLGVPTGAIVGVDAVTETAHELDLLRAAGVDVRVVRLGHGPVFENIERPEGRLQHSEGPSDPVPIDAVPPGWADAPGWILAPVAAELPDAWATVPSPAATVAVGWQGLLRVLRRGEAVEHLPPSRLPILDRADLVGVSRDDVDHSIELAELCRHLRPGATLAVTQGDRGGLVMEAGQDGVHHLRHYPAVHSHRIVDPTGAGDVFLAALAAARIEPRLVGGRIATGYDLLLAAAAASLVLEGPGLLGVPDRAAVRARMQEAMVARARAAQSSG